MARLRLGHHRREPRAAGPAHRRPPLLPRSPSPRRPPGPSGTRTTAGPVPGFPATQRARRADRSTPAARRGWPVPGSRSPVPGSPPRQRAPPPQMSLRKQRAAATVPPQGKGAGVSRPALPSAGHLLPAGRPRAGWQRCRAAAAPARRSRTHPSPAAILGAPSRRRRLGAAPPRRQCRAGPPPPAPRPRPDGERGGRRGPARKRAAGECRERLRTRPPPAPPRLPRALPPPRTHLPIAMCRRRVCHQICSGNRSPSHVSSHLPRPPPPAGPSGPVPRGRTRAARWETPLVSSRGAEELPLSRAVAAGHLFAPRSRR
ncbi:uncharacterized protein LOC143694065 [Agelaius phoeniceus]|uniref:uncharacterized protein LOC143694065 n=1 Tax=Agelaius phoeniceus TaxID=39638 RepID=UPI0040552D4F